MTYFRTERIKHRVNVFDVATGEYLCQLTAKEAPTWIARAK